MILGSACHKMRKEGMAPDIENPPVTLGNPERTRVLGDEGMTTKSLPGGNQGVVTMDPR